MSRRSLQRFRLVSLLLSLGCLTGGLRAAESTANRVEYNRDIRPILSDTCFHCHGPDKNTRKAKLRLDVREDALARGAFVPGKPTESELVKRLFSSDPEELMPPPEAHKPLNPAQKELLQRWIAQGAEYQPHWAYLPPKRPSVPADANPIDALVDARLAEHGTQRSPEADRRTLLRRLSLDLIGLPPTPEEVETFVNDRRPQAYEEQVERLLKSPHYGERMAVPWLDLVRYADTVGYHGDQNVNVFPYRDYVVAAFNRNKPFDQFTMEQLAGDLLPQPSVEARVATGFNRLNMMTREGGAQPKEYLAKYAADRVRTVSMAWLGSTMGCAECHDHKFDPFTQKDFYSLAAFFADVRQWGVYNDYDYTPNPDLKGWSNDHPFPPELEVESPYLRLQAARYADQMEAIARAVADSARSPGPTQTALAAWETGIHATLAQSPDGWISPVPTWDPSAPVSGTPSGTITVVRPATEPEKVGLPKLQYSLPAGLVAAIRLELLPTGTNGITRDGRSTTFRPSFKLIRGTNAPRDLPIQHAEANLDEPRYANGAEFIGIRDNWKTSAKRSNDRHVGVWALAQPLKLQEGDQISVDVRNTALERIRVSFTPLAAANPLRSGATVELVDALARPAAVRTDRERQVVAEAWLLSTLDQLEERRRFLAAHAEYLQCRSGFAPTVVTAAWEPSVTRVLARGNWMDESGEIVSPQPPSFLPRLPWPADRRLTRLDLADWLVAPENPLTTRVFVNRLWKQFFGNGLSAQVEDLGAQGEWPTHPELLDWLAVEFREHGWDVKHLVRLIVLSGTYRQSSNLRPELRDADPANRWLSSQNPRRLEAEFVRDNALFIAGLLNPEVGGPSAFPYQPAGYYANLQFPDRDYQASPGERQYRRGLYAHWQRTFLNPMLANFDAPSREECTASRPVSNTPQQALTLLNDPAFVEASRAFAETLLNGERRTEANRIQAAFQRALARPPRPAELESLQRFFRQQQDYYATHPEEAAKFLRIGYRPLPANAPESELAAWTQVARVILNLHETVTRY